jgi:hypothetical protein
MYTGAIIALVVGTVAVLLVPALVLAGSLPAKVRRRRTAGRH